MWYITSRLTKKLKKLNKRSKEIFLWREKIAENRNIPPNYVFREKYISDLSKIFPNDKLAKKNALVMHPGPMNRGVEIASLLADNNEISLVKKQVEMGVSVRIACLEMLKLSRNKLLK